MSNRRSSSARLVFPTRTQTTHRAFVQESVKGEVFVLGDDHPQTP